VQVEVHHVEAGFARPELAQDRVHVGAVHVGQRTGRMHRVEELVDASLEQAEGGRVGQHHRRRPRPEGRPQGVEVHAAVGRGGHRHRAESGH
jgi:hypothetical protein